MAYESNPFDWVHDIEGLSVLHTEFVVVTADGADHPLYERVAPLLQRIGRALDLDVVFVSQLASGRPCIRRAASHDQREAIAVEHADPLEAGFAHSVLASRDGRGPFIALPVVGKDAFDYGTVGCRSGDESTAEALFSVARLVALALSAWSQPRPIDLWASTAAAPLAAAVQT
jgi:hypothetical protein